MCGEISQGHFAGKRCTHPKNPFSARIAGNDFEIDPSYEFLKADLEVLENYLVRYRYPGITSDLQEAKGAYTATKTVRAFIRQKLGLA